MNEHANEQMNEQAAALYLFRLCLPAFRCCCGHATIGKVLSLQAVLLLEGDVFAALQCVLCLLKAENAMQLTGLCTGL